MTEPNAIKYVAYYRVSTQKQGESGLGLEAQRLAVSRYLQGHPGEVLAEFTETESGKQARNRPALLKALELCRKHRATILLAKIDRISRSLHFISGLMESGVNFVASDMPTKDRFMLHVQAAFAEEEARRISQRTREALAAAKTRGVVIGETGRIRAKRYQQEAIEKAERYRPIIYVALNQGVRTTKQLRDYLNEKNVVGPGAGRWHLPNTFRTLKRLGGMLSIQKKGPAEYALESISATCP